MQCRRTVRWREALWVSIPQAVWIACNYELKEVQRDLKSFNTASGMDCMQFRPGCTEEEVKEGFNTASGMDCMQLTNHNEKGDTLIVSIPQAVWIACNSMLGRIAADAEGVSIPQAVWIACNKARRIGKFSTPSFNTASGMDCMQYRPSQPLGQLNPEAGFLNGSLFLANRRNPAGFFCRQNRLKTSANPVISRKLLSTGKI